MDADALRELLGRVAGGDLSVPAAKPLRNAQMRWQAAAQCHIDGHDMRFYNEAKYSEEHPMSTITPLQSEFQFYLEHQEEIVSRYDGMYVVIKGQEILGAFGSEIDAIREAKKSHELGTFLVQHVSRGDSAYTQSFHSRAVFS